MNETRPWEMGRRKEKLKGTGSDYATSVTRREQQRKRILGDDQQTTEDGKEGEEDK